MKYIITTTLLFILSTFTAFSQVTISPEIGLNYRPYDFLNDIKYNGKSLHQHIHRTPEPYINLNGEVNLTQKIVFHTGIGYIFREKPFVHTRNIIYQECWFINRDMNFDIGVLYALSDNVRIGTGGGMYYKINSYILLDSDYGKTTLRLENNYLYNGHFQLDYKIGKIKIISRYAYFFNTEHKHKILFGTLNNNKHAVSIGVSYELYKNNRKSKSKRR